jgi:ATP-dependent DNA ligase
MTSDKRDFTNFNEFPGEYSEGSGIYEFPPLYHEDSMKHKRVWQIFARLVKDGKRQDTIDWNTMEENQIKIKQKYFQGEDLPIGVIAQIWTVTGVIGGKITRSVPTYFDKSAFVGKKNERNAWQQALIKARSLYLLKEQKGGTTKLSGKKTVKKDTEGTIKYFPMLARKWAESWKYLEFPAYLQPKLDGVRCIIYLEKPDSNYKHVVIYSRQQKDFPGMEYLQIALYPYLNALYDKEKQQSIYLDGELYNHGKSLQDISGESRNTIKASNIDKLNYYYIYDCFYPLEPETTFHNRLKQLKELFKSIEVDTEFVDCSSLPNSTLTKDIIRETPTHLVNNMNEVNEWFDKYTSGKYEGVILRNKKGVYLFDPKRTGVHLRSHDLVKMKSKETAEYEIVGFTEGSKGKDKGALIWILATEDGKQFNVTPKDITYDERKELFKKAQINFKPYLGRMLTIEFEALSKDGIPQRAKALNFRDVE